MDLMSPGNLSVLRLFILVVFKHLALPSFVFFVTSDGRVRFDRSLLVARLGHGNFPATMTDIVSLFVLADHRFCS